MGYRFSTNSEQRTDNYFKATDHRKGNINSLFHFLSHQRVNTVVGYELVVVRKQHYPIK
jgi:hypothetical protein